MKARLFLWSLVCMVGFFALAKSAQAATNNAQFIAQTVPATMTQGQSYVLSVTMKNTGDTTWTSAYRLGSQNSADNLNWGFKRVTLADGEAITPGQQKVFTLNVTAPASAATYNFQWRMVQDGVEWFGELTPNVAVQVGASPTSVTVTVNTNQTGQTIEGIGANYPWGYIHHDGTNDLAARYTMDNLNPRHIRMFFHSMDFEPVNDNSDSQNFNWPAFKDAGKVHEEFLFMQDMQAKGATIVFSPWKFPDWMTEGVSNGSPTYRIPENMYDEAIELIAATLVRAKDTYGADINYISFNEPNGNWDVHFSSTEMVNFIKKAGPRLEALGLDVKWLMGDTSNAGILVSYTRPQLEMLMGTEYEKYVGPISFHSYWSFDDTILSDVHNLAEQYGLKVWCEEVGTNSGDSVYATQIPTWGWAFDTAKMYHRILKYSGASATAHWAYGKYWSIVNPTTLNPYPLYYVIEQLGDFLPVGSQVVESSSGDLEVLTLAAKNPGNKYGLLLINNASSGSKAVSVSGVPAGQYEIFRTSATEKNVSIGMISVAGNSAAINLPAQSITTLSSDGVSGDTAPPAAPSGLSVQ